LLPTRAFGTAGAEAPYLVSIIALRSATNRRAG
jgi:hypothetical protein